MAHLAVKNLTFAFPGASAPALNDVSLDIPDGAFTLICGRSGCGKTTLLRHLKTVLTPHGERTGTVLMDGCALEEIPLCEQAVRIGYVAQSPDDQIVCDKVWHEVAFGLENMGIKHEAMRSRVAETVSSLGIEGIMREPVENLSGGQKQLVNLASVLALHPDVLVLDEPTAQLDPVAAKEFLAIVRRLNEDFGMTVIVVEQRLEDVYTVADVVVAMDDGAVVASGAPEEVAVSLCLSNDAMAAALPASMRVWWDIARGGGVVHGVPGDRPPLTVRDGRRWLKAAIGANVSTVPIDGIAPDVLTRVDDAPVAIELSDVWFRCGRDERDVLQNVSLSVRQGEVCALMGGNGVGKSTILKVMCGVAKPYRGKVRIFGETRRAHGHDMLDTRLAMLPQDPRSLFVHETVLDDLLEMTCAADDEHKRMREAHAVAKSLGIDRALHAHPYDLSGGEMQRAALAKVLIAHPSIILLDEPTKGLDVCAKQELAAAIKRLAAEGTTVVMVSHDVEFCASVADTMSMLFDGTITAQADPRTFLSANMFYTTAASRMSRGVFYDAVTVSDVIALCRRCGI